MNVNWEILELKSVSLSATGSGYITACFSNIVGPEGKVVGVENEYSAFQYGRSCIEKASRFALRDGNVTLFCADVFQGESLLIL